MSPERFVVVRPSTPDRKKAEMKLFRGFMFALAVVAMWLVVPVNAQAPPNQGQTSTCNSYYSIAQDAYKARYESCMRYAAGFSGTQYGQVAAACGVEYAGLTALNQLHYTYCIMGGGGK
jgi:hypothetical protein